MTEAGQTSNRRPKPGELYRHFKNKMYQILAVARHSETGEELVIYQALYGDYSVYARPLAMFNSEVDHKKYPDVTQKYRFEQVDRDTLEPACPRRQEEPVPEKKQASGDFLHDGGQKAEVSRDDAEEEQADERLLRFLDADTYQEKYEVLAVLANDITDRLINDFAVIVDVVIPEGSLNERYEQLKNAIATRARYETGRLR